MTAQDMAFTGYIAAGCSLPTKSRSRSFQNAQWISSFQWNRHCGVRALGERRSYNNYYFVNTHTNARVCARPQRKLK